MFVIDASVATKWYLIENGSDKARGFAMDASELFAPSLIATEVLSSITKSHRFKHISIDHAKILCDRWIKHLRNSIVQTVKDQEDQHAAISIALETKHAYQDCLYVALAKRLQVPLLSADHKQLEIAAQQKVTSLRLAV